MIYHEEYRPSGLLEEYVAGYYILEHTGNAKQASLQRITPDGCVEIGFNLDSPMRRIGTNGKAEMQKNFYVVSRFSEHYFLQRTGPVRFIGLRLYPWGISSFSGISPADLRDKSISLHDIFGNDASRLQESVTTITNHREVILAIDKFLITRLLKFEKHDPVVADASKRIFRSKGIVNMDALISPYGMSHRSFQQRFKSIVGVSSKSYSRVVRFQHALRQLNEISEHNLVHAALDNGYFDQPHFNHDFRSFSGTTPSQYVSENHGLGRLMTNSLFTDYSF